MFIREAHLCFINKGCFDPVIVQRQETSLCISVGGISMTKIGAIPLLKNLSCFCLGICSFKSIKLICYVVTS